MGYKMLRCIRRTLILQSKSRKKQSPNIKHDEINIVNIINDNTF